MLEKFLVMTMSYQIANQHCLQTYALGDDETSQ